MRTKTRTWSIFESKIDGLWIDPIGLKLESPQSKKNAALIAAAPEMLEALESLTHEVYRLSGNTLSPKSEPIMVKALESMRKAKGEE